MKTQAVRKISKRLVSILFLVAMIALPIYLMFQLQQAKVIEANYIEKIEVLQHPNNSLFTSGSNQSDGALILTEPGTYVFDPRSFEPPLDPDGDHIYHFTDIIIGSNVTVVMKSPYLTAPVYWLASGDVQVDGIIDLSGEDGHAIDDPVLGNRRISIPGAGGFPGGIGQSLPTNIAQPGSGPGGGGTRMNNGGGAGHATSGNCAFDNPCGQAYGNDFLVPLIGGSGGGGGRFSGNYSNAAGGGAGGGALLIASSTIIKVNGLIKSNGGTGNGPSPGSGVGVGGSGSGGAIHLLAPVISGTGTLNALSFATNGNYGWGSSGRIRLDALEHEFTGNVNPAPRLGTLFALVLPTNQPSIKVVGVNGIAAPEVPTGEHIPSDVTLNASSAVTIEIEAEFIPVGTMATLYIFSENNGDQIISAPLAGTFENSSTIISATVPFGPSRIHVESDWTP